MKLFSFAPAPNAKRLQMFLDEKKIQLEVIELNVREGEQFHEPFKTMNPFNCIPFLELDDNTIIAETISICRYLDELYPQPYLFGETHKQRALIDMWNRRLELDGFLPLLHAIRNSSPRFEGKVIPGTRNNLPQLPAIADRGLEMFKVLLDRIDPHLKSHKFIIGSMFSIADITGHYMMELSEPFKIDIENRYPNIFRWNKLIGTRGSLANE